MARMRKIREDRKRVGKQVSMSRVDWEEVDNLAEDLGMTRSEMVRLALDEYRERKAAERAREKRAEERAAERQAAEAQS